MHLVGITSSLINRSISTNDQLKSWVSKAMNASDIRGNDLDSMVQNAYEYGRVWLPTQARRLVRDNDPDRAAIMEAQVRLLLDKLYGSWDERKEGRSTKALTKGHSPFNLVWENLQESTDIRVLTMDLVNFVKENVGTVLSVRHLVLEGWTGFGNANDVSLSGYGNSMERAQYECNVPVFDIIRPTRFGIEFRRGIAPVFDQNRK